MSDLQKGSHSQDVLQTPTEMMKTQHVHQRDVEEGDRSQSGSRHEAFENDEVSIQYHLVTYNVKQSARETLYS